MRRESPYPESSYLLFGTFFVKLHENEKGIGRKGAGVRPSRAQNPSVCIYYTDRKGKAMFSQMFVCPQSASWLTVIAQPCYGAVGMHPTGMLSCFLVSTYVVCEGLSVMQRQARLPEIFDQIAQFTPKLEFGSRTPPPPN